MNAIGLTLQLSGLAIAVVALAWELWVVLRPDAPAQMPDVQRRLDAQRNPWSENTGGSVRGIVNSRLGLRGDSVTSPTAGVGAAGGVGWTTAAERRLSPQRKLLTSTVGRSRIRPSPSARGCSPAGTSAPGAGGAEPVRPTDRR